ncbi:MAG: hypothetical protein WAU07_00980 [Microgenomates group bacterium]
MNLIALQLLAQFGGGFEPPVDSTFTQGADTNPEVNLEIIVSNLLGVATVFAGIFFLVYFLIASFKWISAGGDSGKVQGARDQMMNGVLGLVMVVGTYTIVAIISVIVGFNILNPAAIITDSLIP